MQTIFNEYQGYEIANNEQNNIISSDKRRIIHKDFMMSKVEFHTNFKEHTLVKLELYKKYLEAYLPILSNTRSVDKIEIYDLFCGKGHTDAGQLGSALIGLEQIINTASVFNSSKQFVIHYHDLDTDCCEELEIYVKKIKRPDNVTYKINCNDFSKEIESIIQLQNNKSANQRVKSLFFIDPYGYRLISPEIVLQIKKNVNAEVMMFLPITEMYRFRTMNKPNTSLKVWTDFIYRREGTCDNVTKFAHDISDAFKSKSYYSGYFILHNQEFNNTYAIFFLSSHIYGLDRFNEAKWKIDKQGGIKMDVDQMTMSISIVSDGVYQTNLIELKQIIINAIKDSGKGKFNNKEMYEFLINTGYLPQHFNELMKKDGFLNVHYLSVHHRRGLFINYNHYNSEPLVEFSLKS